MTLFKLSAHSGLENGLAHRLVMENLHCTIISVNTEHIMGKSKSLLENLQGLYGQPFGGRSKLAYNIEQYTTLADRKELTTKLDTSHFLSLAATSSADMFYGRKGEKKRVWLPRTSTLASLVSESVEHAAKASDVILLLEKDVYWLRNVGNKCNKVDSELLKHSLFAGIVHAHLMGPMCPTDMTRILTYLSLSLDERTPITDIDGISKKFTSPSSMIEISHYMSVLYSVSHSEPRKLPLAEKQQKKRVTGIPMILADSNTGNRPSVGADSVVKKSETALEGPQMDEHLRCFKKNLEKERMETLAFESKEVDYYINRTAHSSHDERPIGPSRDTNNPDSFIEDADTQYGSDTQSVDEGHDVAVVAVAETRPAVVHESSMLDQDSEEESKVEEAPRVRRRDVVWNWLKAKFGSAEAAQPSAEEDSE